MAKKKPTTTSTKNALKPKSAKKNAKLKPDERTWSLARPGDTLDVDVRIESDRYLMLDGCHGLPKDEPRMKSTRRLVESGLQIILPFEGGGMLARFRLGAADSLEEAAWFARAVGWLDLTGGWLSYGSSSGPPILVPPNMYQLEISCLAHSWSHYLLGKVFGEKFQNYVEQAAHEPESQGVEVVIRLTKMNSRRPALRLDRSGCALEDNWQVRMPLPAKIPLAAQVHYGLLDIG